MLRFLRVRRLAVIDSVEVEFEPGLNVLTGETGAGKSILVEAVGLLLGGRASGDLVRTGEDSASIEAIFESGGEELLVRREITAAGQKPRVRERRVDDRRCAQGSGVAANRAPRAARTPDAARPVNAPRHARRVRRPCAAGRSGCAGIHRLSSRDGRTRDRSTLGVAADRTAGSRAIPAGRTRKGGAQTWRGRRTGRGQADSGATPSAYSVSARRRMRRSTTPTTRCSRCSAASGDVWASWPPWTRSSRRIWTSAMRSNRSSTISRSSFGAMRTALRRRQPDFSRSKTGSRSSSERNGNTDRRWRMRSPDRNRFGRSSSAWGRATSRWVSSNASRGWPASDTLPQPRRSARLAARPPRRLRDRSSGRLADLALDRTRFEVRFAENLPEDGWTAHGIDQAEFWLSPNVGEELRPLVRIASGGELSRIMLALKTQTATDAARVQRRRSSRSERVDAGSHLR